MRNILKYEARSCCGDFVMGSGRIQHGAVGYCNTTIQFCKVFVGHGGFSCTPEILANIKYYYYVCFAG